MIDWIKYDINNKETIPEIGSIVVNRVYSEWIVDGLDYSLWYVDNEPFDSEKILFRTQCMTRSDRDDLDEWAYIIKGYSDHH